jgi:hypothetical protein
MENHLTNMEVSAKVNIERGGGEYEEPQGDLEQAITQLWKDVFHMDNIGRADNFFELGGNSLLGMDLSELFTTRLALDVPVLLIFQHPTIAEIAQIISSQ